MLLRGNWIRDYGKGMYCPRDMATTGWMAERSRAETGAGICSEDWMKLLI